MYQFVNADVEPFMATLAGSEKIEKFITLGSPTAGPGRWSISAIAQIVEQSKAEEDVEYTSHKSRGKLTEDGVLTVSEATLEGKEVPGVVKTMMTQPQAE